MTVSLAPFVPVHLGFLPLLSVVAMQGGRHVYARETPLPRGKGKGCKMHPLRSYDGGFSPFSRERDPLTFRDGPRARRAAAHVLHCYRLRSQLCCGRSGLLSVADSEQKLQELGRSRDALQA